jgi:hypothetical protein
MIRVSVREPRTLDPEWIAPHASVQAAACSMKARNIGLGTFGADWVAGAVARHSAGRAR